MDAKRTKAQPGRTEGTIEAHHKATANSVVDLLLDRFGCTVKP